MKVLLCLSFLLATSIINHAMDFSSDGLLYESQFKTGDQISVEA